MLEIFTTIMGVMMSLGYYPQAYKIYKTKSAKDVSLSTFLIFGIGTVTWTIYGFYTKDLTIILGFLVGVFGSWLVVGLYLFYKNKNHE
ncbi:hypothetical protein KKG48_02270 [Patescibacteria group bacterium]|nr:hypothetical protein [Patescibacteria group bacterium]